MKANLWSAGIAALIFVLTVGLLLAHTEIIEILAGKMTGMGILSYLVFVLILIIAVVAMPVTVMPLIPVAAGLFGPFPTAILSIVGWTLGGALAFLIARYLGRPFLEQFVSFKKVDTLADRIPQRARFLTVVLLRLTLPVDLVSYALGFSRSIGFFEYLLGTFVGVIWFSFAFAYMGDALLQRDLLVLIEVGTISVFVFAACWFWLTKKR